MASWGVYWDGFIASLEDHEAQAILDAWDKMGQISATRGLHNLDYKAKYAMAGYFSMYPNWVRWAKSYGRGIHVRMTWPVAFSWFWVCWVWPR